MRSGPTPRQWMSRVQRSRVVPRGLPAPPVFRHVPYSHLELNKDGTSYFIRCGLPMPRCYRPELLVGPARAAAPAIPNPAAPECRMAYAVHSAALPIAATHLYRPRRARALLAFRRRRGNSLHSAVDLDSRRRCGGTGYVRADRGDGPTASGSGGVLNWKWGFCIRTPTASPRASGPKPPGERIDER